ncbi:MAG: T9SS type A sorting domain-containing protein [Ignavibacteria bacterium]|nr:T9SS type A sorting domain-containing protein [Ignavibacteria bacterium]
MGTDTRLTNNAGVSILPAVTASGLIVHTVWIDDRDGNNEIYYRRSTDLGLNWGAETRLTNNSSSSYNPSVSVSGSNVHVTWYDLRDGNNEIYYKRSTDGGITWGADNRLTYNTSLSYDPCSTVSGSIIHVVWTDTRDNNKEIYYKRSTDNGVSWSPDVRLTTYMNDSMYPSVTASGPVVHITWTDYHDGNYEIYYRCSTDGGTAWEPDSRLTNNPGVSVLSSAAVTNSSVHTVWYDDRDGNAEIYYKRNPTGSPTGITITGSAIPENFSLAQNYPNPFNPSATIQFFIPLSRWVSAPGGRDVPASLVVYDILGNEVKILVDQQLPPGSYSINFDASGLASGMYFYKLASGEFTDTKKMLLIK